MFLLKFLCWLMYCKTSISFINIHFGYWGVNWYKAEVACLRQHNAHLATINSASDNTAALAACSRYLPKNTLNCECWFGINNIYNQNQYSYPNNISTSYSNWVNPTYSANQCGYVYSSDYGCWDDRVKWYSYPCDGSISQAICNDENSANSTHVDLTPNYIPIKQTLSWYDAGDFCLIFYQSHLATVTSPKQNEEVIYIQRVLLSNTAAYIGLYQNNWANTNHSSLLYRNWYYSASSSSCGYIDFNNYGFWWKDKYCDDELNAFICDPANSASASLISNKKYVLVEKLHSWYSSDDYCYWKYSSHVATIETLGDNFAVFDLCHNSDNVEYNCWFGTFNDPDNGWITPAFDTLNYSNWAANQANKEKYQCGYVTATGNGRHWLSDSCLNSNNMFVCNPLNSLNTNELPTNKVYIAVNLEYNWTSAESYCQNVYGSHLATIWTENENNEVANLCRNLGLDTDCWIGLKKHDNIYADFRFRWIENGSLLHYTKWFEGQPALTNNDIVCGYIDSLNDNHGRYWMADDSCSVKKSFICNPSTITTSTQPIGTTISKQTTSISKRTTSNRLIATTISKQTTSNPQNDDVSGQMGPVATPVIIIVCLCLYG
eukprot:410736_1